MSRLSTTLLASAAALAMAGTASAAYDITINSVDRLPDPAISEKVSLNGGQSYFSSFPTTLVADSSIGSFMTLCVEFEQSTHLPAVFSFQQAGDPHAFTAAEHDSLARLFQAANFRSTDTPPGAVDTAAKQVGLQLAVWDLVTDGNVDFNGGLFRVSTDNAGGVAYANSLWAAAQAIDPANLTWSVNKLYSAQTQDYIHVVPEPSTYALMVAGLLGIGFVARRRSASRG